MMITLLFVVLRFVDVRQGRSNMAELKQLVLLQLKAGLRGPGLSLLSVAIVQFTQRHAMLSGC